jgi:outer membrane autotransporter protein
VNFCFFNQNQKKAVNSGGTATDLGFGLYGAWTASEKISVKANAGLGMQSVSAKNSEFDGSADFETMSVRFGVEAQYGLGKLKPFIGINGGYVSSPEISAKTAGETVATIEAATYLRLSGLAGIKIESTSTESKLNWFGKGYLGLLLAGAKAEHTVTPKSDSEEVAGYTVNASEESTLFFGLGAGLGYSLTKNVTAKIGFDLNLAGSGTAYLGNIGISYKF